MPLCIRIKDGVGVGRLWRTRGEFLAILIELCTGEWRGSVLCEPSVMPMNRLRKEGISSVQFSSVQLSSVHVDEVDRFYVAPFSALEHTYCALN